jgi:hypothetical protein
MPRVPGILGDVFSSGGNPYGSGNRTYGTGSQAFHPGDPPCANPFGCAHGTGQGNPSTGPGTFYGGASNDVYCQQSPGQPMYGPYHGTGTNTPCGPNFAPRAQQPTQAQPQPPMIQRPPTPGGGCVVYAIDGILVRFVQASLERQSGIVLVQSNNQDGAGCSDNAAPARPLTQFQLGVQLTDAECAWYWNVTEAIAKQWQKYITDPRYTKPAAGTKVTVDYVILGKPFYSNGGIMWDGWRVSGDSGQLEGLGFSWDSGMAARDVSSLKNFASNALADVSKTQLNAERAGRTGPLTYLPHWQRAPALTGPQVWQGKQIWHGVHLQSTFSVNSGGPPHLYNVACIDWIRRNKDANANAADGSTPIVFVVR